MKITLSELIVLTRQTTERVSFSPTVSFIHGPVGTGKSTVARLIDYCFGGSLERTPAIQQEFVSATLTAILGPFTVQLERGLKDTGAVRATWSDGLEQYGSVSAPLEASAIPIVGDDVFSLSDLLFFLCGVQPIKVRKSKMDPDSPLVRLSFRDLMWYCYLEQDHLDSSFFRMEDPFRKLKSRDAMRFVTGLHSERMNQLDVDLVRAVDEQRSKREAVKQLRVFMARFEMGTEFDIMAQIGQVDVALREAQARRDELERTRSAQTHAVEPLRQQLRELSGALEDGQRALGDVALRVQQYEGLRSELIASKVKLTKAEQAGRMLQGVEFKQCPQCGSEIATREPVGDTCGLCGSPPRSASEPRSLEREALRRELNERIDDLAESLNRHKRDKARQERFVAELVARKGQLDQQLTADLSRYDTAYVSSVRAADRDVATLQERRAALDRLRELPQAINELEEQAGALQGRIDSLRSGIEDERAHLRVAYERTRRIATNFFELMRRVGFPGVYEDDHVEIDPRTWLPSVHHQDVIWGFGDAGSGGKKTLFNVLYALAVHQVAAEEDLPLPAFLIIDGPTKNISEDENPELVKALYRAIYALAVRDGRALQFILIDSDLVAPETELREFAHRRMAGTAEEPCLISYYSGP